MPHSSGGGYGGIGGSSFGSSGGSFGSGSTSGSGYSGGLASGDNWSVTDAERRRKNYRYAYYDRYGNLNYFYSSRADNLPWVIWIIGIFLSLSVVLGFSFVDAKPLSSNYTNSVITDTAHKFSAAEKKELQKCIEEFNAKTGIPVEIHTAPRAECEGYGSFTNYAYNYYVSNYRDEYHWVIVYVDDSSGWRWEGMQGNNTDSVLTEHKTSKFNSIVNDCLSSNKTTPGRAFIEAFSTVTPNIMKNDLVWSNKTRTILVIVLIVLFLLFFIPALIKNRKYKNAFRVDGSGRSYYD